MHLGVQNVGFTCGAFDFVYRWLASSHAVQPSPATVQSKIPTLSGPSFLAIHCKALDNLSKVVLFFFVYIASDPRRSLSSLLGLTLTPYPTSPKSFPLISITDPHPLTFLESYRFKNRGGRSYPQLRVPATSHSDKPFTCNTYAPPRKCCKKKTYASANSQLSPVDAPLTKNEGRAPC